MAEISPAPVDYFCGNRVGEIHTLCPNISWHHIASKSNPADIASRGCSSSELLENALWWTGPDFLSDSTYKLSQDPEFITSEEQRPLNLCTVSLDVPFWITFINRFSSYNRLVRTMAYVLRIKPIIDKLSIQFSKHLEAFEVQAATEFLIKELQAYFFPQEYENLSKSLLISPKSKIRSLCPAINDRNLIIVQGRFQPNRNYQPILLPKGNFANLMILKAHHDTFHGSLELVMSWIRRHYWIINMKQTAKRIIRSCDRCKRYRADTYKPSMGPLPVYRTQQSKPFSTYRHRLCRTYQSQSNENTWKYNNERLYRSVYMSSYKGHTFGADHESLSGLINPRTQTFLISSRSMSSHVFRQR